MKKLKTLFGLSVMAVCSLTAIGCKQDAPVTTEKPEMAAPEAKLGMEAKPADEATIPAMEQPAADKPKDHPAH